MKNFLKRWIEKLFPKPTFERGWECADEQIRMGRSSYSVRIESCRDLFPDKFTDGWNARCSIKK